jgi:helix-turn-helix protein
VYRAATCEALIEALHIYTPLHGTLRDFLSKHIKNRLLEHNKQFSRINNYNSFSLDAPIRIDEENSTSFHEMLSVNSINIIDEIESKADMELFCDRYLDEREKQVFIMLNSGYTEFEITERFCMTSPELSAICSSIGGRWKKFNEG